MSDKDPTPKPEIPPEWRPYLRPPVPVGFSLLSAESFLWSARAFAERDNRNLSANHLAVALAMQKLIEAGIGDFSHAEIAAAAHCCTRTVGEATRRLRELGLLAWKAQYRVAGPLRRRIENRYRLCPPAGSPLPRPELRRRRLRGTCRASQGIKIEEAEFAFQAGAPPPPPPGWQARVAAKAAQERAKRAAWGRIRR